MNNQQVFDRPEITDIQWVGSLSEGLRLGKRLQRPIVIKAAGQGLESAENW